MSFWVRLRTLAVRDKVSKTKRRGRNLSALQAVINFGHRKRAEAMKLHPFTLHNALLFLNNIPSATQSLTLAVQVPDDFFATVSCLGQSYEAASTNYNLSQKIIIKIIEHIRSFVYYTIFQICSVLFHVKTILLCIQKKIFRKGRCRRADKGPR